jgi:peptidoglycan/xylan/chitin deacetylase (PgdA/CDA1 family)
MYRRRRTLRCAVCAGGAVIALLFAGTSVAAAETVVSLELDDAWASQYDLRPELAARGLPATFFVNSGFLGRSGRLTAAQVSALAADGNEIGGHTIDHADLTTLPLDQRRREVCDDRVALLGQGLAVTNFAYPYGHHDAATEQVVADCGYNSARTIGGIASPVGCAACPYAETIPPAARYATRTPDNVRATDTLASLQTLVTQAEDHGGGWVQIVLHQICGGCGPYGAPRSLIVDLLDWLMSRRSRGTVVRTVAAVVGGSVQPGVPAQPAVRPGNLLANGSLEADVNGDGQADCWQRAGFGDNTFVWTRTRAAHSGSWAERLDISAWTSGDRKLIPALDAGACAPAGVPGHSYRFSEWYAASAPVRVVAYTRDATGAWAFWAKSPYLPPASAWTEATWTTPALPAGATALSAGLALDTTGTATFDDAGIYDSAP